MKDENESALKHLFGKDLLKRIADSVGEHHPEFDRKAFLALMPKLHPLEMKSRVRLLRDELRRHLPQDYKTALGILRKAHHGRTLDGFDYWPLTEFVQTYGLEDPVLSLDALSEFTKVFTSEWAVRPFIKKDTKATLKFLEQCAKSKEESLRRWASEGTRPRLPWGERLHEFVRDPKPTARILELLKFDDAVYVRTSVANHLNDISKDHPSYVVTVLRRWKKEAGSAHAPKIDWIVRRSLRTLIKAGHAGALELIGVSKNAEIEFRGFKVHQKEIKLGDKIDFEFEIISRSKKPQNIVVDYIVHFVKSNKSTAPKVFKLKNAVLPAGGTLKVLKSHQIKKITTREYYSGLHAVEVQINGVAYGKREWKLRV